MKYPLFKKYFITTTLECYNQYLDYLKTINTYNIKIVDQEVTFYSNVLIEIDGFKCSNSFKDVYLKVLIKYLLLLISIITILIILFVTPYYIREVKYQASSIKDDIVFQKTQEMVKQHKKLNLNELSKYFSTISFNGNFKSYRSYKKINFKKCGQRRCTRKDTTPVLFAIRRVVLLRSFIVLRTVLFASRVCCE